VTGHAAVGAEEFRALFDEVCTWRRWGERGALETITADRIAAACALVRTGRAVSLGLPLATEPRADNPQPAVHRMTLLHSVDIGSGTVRFAKDYVGVDFHNDGHSHVDAFSHVAFDGQIYGGQPAGSVTARGAGTGSIAVLRDGLVGRGVLLDVPRTRGLPWLEPGDHILMADLEAAERAQDVRVGPGDILLVRTGYTRRLAELPPWNTARAKAGLHPVTARFLSARGVAALGSDANSDTAPSITEGIGFPIHVLAVTAMGLHLLDYLSLEDVAAECERAGRWEFLFVAAPLRIERGTGSPVNPLAIF
jgi:kynurenine formamidase